MIVLSIWEGTTDVLASGAVKTLKGRDSLTLFSALSSWIANAMEIENSPSFAMEKDLTKQRFKVFRHNVDLRQAGELLRNAREIIEQLGDIICMVLLIVDAESDGDEWAGEICRRFCRSKITHEVHIQASPKDLEWDRKIAFHNRADRSRKNKL